MAKPSRPCTDGEIEYDSEGNPWRCRNGEWVRDNPKVALPGNFRHHDGDGAPSDRDPDR